jgi:hypothetical protein
MSDGKTIWAVSSGDYFDYRVNAVFSTKEKAEAYAKRFNELSRRTDDYGVEEYPLDPSTPAEGLESFLVFIQRNGDIERVYRCSYGFDEVVTPLWNKGGWSVRCFARDREHAIKIAGEKRQEELAREALVPKAHPCSTDPKEGLR